jgi:hypothetical protein
MRRVRFEIITTHPFAGGKSSPCRSAFLRLSISVSQNLPPLRREMRSIALVPRTRRSK